MSSDELTTAGLTTGEVFRRGARLIGRSLRAMPGSHAIALTGALVFSVAAVVLARVLGWVTDEVIVPGLDDPQGIGAGTLWTAIGLIFGVGMLRGSGSVVRRFFLARARYGTERLWRRQLFEQYLRLPMAFHQSRPTGELLAHADNDLTVASSVLMPFAFTAATVALVVISVASLFLVHPVFALVALVLFPVLASMNHVYTSRVHVPASAAQAAVGDVSAIAHESFDGVLVVKALGREQAEVDRLRVAGERLRDRRLEVGRYRALFEPAIDALPNLGIIALLVVGATLVDQGEVTVGDLVGAMTLFSIMAMPMRIVGFFLEEMPRSVVALQRIDRVLDIDTPPVTGGDRHLPPGPVGLAFEHVHAGYEGIDVLDDVSFEVHAGESVALVGATGGGKSTIARLLAALHPPDGGVVSIGGVPVDELVVAERAAALAMAFQETFLFADSVLENVVLGRRGIDEAQARRALTLAGASEFVDLMPQGIHTVVGERGVTLSGGQRQRIALARALAGRPRVVFLDDATSAVDPVVEERILDNLRGGLDLTLLIVAHRLSTIRLADRIVFLADGRIAGAGTHDELMSLPGYAALARAYESEVAFVSIHEIERPTTFEPIPEVVPTRAGSLDAEGAEVKAGTVLRRGMQLSPELRRGAVVTLVMALFVAAGRLTVPILVQQILDRGVRGPDGFRPGFVYTSCAVAFLVVAVVGVAGGAMYFRLVRVAENTLLELRQRTFAHLQALSLADHVGSRTGILTARVTSDVETLAQFAQWGAIVWPMNTVVIIATLAVMFVYNWALTLLIIAVYIPMVPALLFLQKRQFKAYEQVRTSVSTTMGAASEAVQGAGVIRAYDYREPVEARLEAANQDQFRSQVWAAQFFAWLAPLTDGFAAAALSSVVGVGVWWGDDLGVSSGELVAFLFLVTILLNPIAELGEVLDQTQTALAGWWKIIQVLDVPIEIVEPADGMSLPTGPLEVDVCDVSFSYRVGPRVLDHVSVMIPAGTAVAVVGETGSGKTTFARLLARLADPAEGQVRIGGIDLREVDPRSRRSAVRIVPQDGFLFDDTVGNNICFGREGATAADAEAAIERLGLGRWLAGLPRGLDTAVGERGESLSVGERQLVALARAQLADPGVLILDEATSAVDAETEVAMSAALARVAAGRTTITVAHRLSTAEKADLVLVFDAGRIVESGSHAELVALDGRYAALHRSWVGNTR